MNETDLQKAFDKIRNGDREAFTLLYSDLKQPIYTIICRIVQSRETAEDITQDVFVKLFVSPPEPSVKNIRAWIFRMARNLAIDALRQKQPCDPLEEHSLQADPDPTVKLDLERAFARLTAGERQLVALHLSAGLTFREVASMVERPLGTVLWQYRKAIEKLRNTLDGGCL